MAKPDSTPEQRADAALKLAGRLQELNVVQGKAGEVIKEWLGSVPSAEQVVKDLNTLSDPNASKTDKVASALSLSDSLGKLLPGKLEESLKPLLSSLAGGSELAKSIAKWADPEASALDKAKAALDLAKSIKSTVGEFSPDLARKLKSLDSSLNSVGNAMTLLDPNASVKDKAEAALGLASDVPQIAGDLKALKTWLTDRGVPDAAAISDEAARLPAAQRLPQAVRSGLSDEAARKLTPEQAEQMAKSYAQNASQLREKAMGLSDPAERNKALASLQDDARAYGASVSKAVNGLSDPKAVDALVKELAASPDLASRRALADAVGGMKPGMADQLLTSQFGDKSGAQVLAKATQSLDADGTEKLTRLMGDLGSKEAAKAFGDTLSRTSAAGLPQLVNTLEGMKPGVADKLLTSQIDGKPAAEVLSGVMDKLDKDSADKLGKILAGGDEKAAKFALQLASSADASVLKETLKLIGDPEMAGKALQAFSSVLDKAGIKMTADIAGKLLKGVAKAVPLAGAIPAGIDAVKMGQIAADTSLPPDIRFMAMQAAKVNGVDALLSVAEPFIAEFGVPILVDLGLAAVETVMDIVVSSEKEKFEADPKNYKSPDWLKAANVGLAVASGPAGAAELAMIYGPEGATDLVAATAKMAGKGAIYAAEMQHQLAAQGVGKGMELTADGLHTMADIIRNPEKYGEMAKQMAEDAVNKLGELAKGAGELAQQAAETLGNVVKDLKAMGEKGLEQLKWIASHPGEAAAKAATALKDMATEAMKLGTEAAKRIAQGAMAALATAQDALAAAGEAGLKALNEVKQATVQVVDAALAAGKKGLDTLAWIANNPGEAAQMAKDAIQNVIAQGGEMAKQAWDSVKDLGEKGLKLAGDVIKGAKELGEKGVELLKYAVENPGEAAEAVRKAAVDVLKSIAQGVGDAAKAATDAVCSFVDNGITEAKQVVEELLTAGGDAAKRIAETWGKELSEGAKQIMDGLKDLGDAGAEALGDLAEAGVKGAFDLYNWAKGEGVPFIPGI